MKTTEKVSVLKINRLSEEQYNKAYEDGTLDPTAFYLTPDNTEALLEAKVDKVTGKGLSSNDFTDEHKARLERQPYYTEDILVSSNWDSSDQTYNFELTYPNARFEIEIQPRHICTKAQIDAWMLAMIFCSYESNVIKAFGTIPSVDIPIVIRVMEK
ncbi:hypothetical protein M2140_000172 [Clostridiales Family XIII bacterium PM5-7]